MRRVAGVGGGGVMGDGGERVNKLAAGCEVWFFELEMGVAGMGGGE